MTSQVMKASTLEISKTMTKGNGERLHFGHSFMDGLVRIGSVDGLFRFPVSVVDIPVRIAEPAYRRHLDMSFQSIALRIVNLMASVSVFQAITPAILDD